MNGVTGVEAMREITRESAAHIQFSNAVERFRKAEGELGHAMDDLIEAIARMRELKITVDVEMKPSTAAAWTEHRAMRRPPEERKR